MAADGECGLREGEIHCRGEVRSRRHQRSGAKGAGLLKLNDGSVDAWRETKVVCVDNQALHFRQCTKGPICSLVHQRFNRVGPYTNERTTNYSYGQPTKSATINSLSRGRVRNHVRKMAAAQRARLSRVCVVAFVEQRWTCSLGFTH